jgi:hypothetical protein
MGEVNQTIGPGRLKVAEIVGLGPVSFAGTMFSEMGAEFIRVNNSPRASTNDGVIQSASAFCFSLSPPSNSQVRVPPRTHTKESV